MRGAILAGSPLYLSATSTRETDPVSDERDAHTNRIHEIFINTIPRRTMVDGVCIHYLFNCKDGNESRAQRYLTILRALTRMDWIFLTGC